MAFDLRCSRAVDGGGCSRAGAVAVKERYKGHRFELSQTRASSCKHHPLSSSVAASQLSAATRPRGT